MLKAFLSRLMKRSACTNSSFGDGVLAESVEAAAASTATTAVKRRKQKEPFWTDSLKPEYYFENGLRKIKPYYFEYKTHAKERWYGRSLLEVFKSEFRDRTEAYYEVAMSSGLISVNGKAAEMDHVVRNGDVICHKIHRHEPPITADPVRIVFESEEMVVVDKPASVPVHPSGRYRFNSLIEILKHEHNLPKLGIINRLDRLTSGIVMLGRDPKHAVELHKRMEAREYWKTYVARVVGQFPAEEITCDAPLKSVEHKLGLVNVCVEGKESMTVFKRLFYDEEKDESVVEASPLTGRTHQIRVHLQALGHPIVNDHLYNNPVWTTVEPASTHPYKSYSPESLRSVADALLKTTFYDEFVDPTSTGTVDEASLCPECDSERMDPEKDKLCIFLHAMRYSCAEFEYSTDLPAWATNSQ